MMRATLLLFLTFISLSLFASIDLETYEVHGKIFSFNEQEVRLKTESGIMSLPSYCFTQDQLKSTSIVKIQFPCIRSDSFTKKGKSCRYVGGSPQIILLNKCQDGGFSYCRAKVECDDKSYKELYCSSEGRKLCPSNPHTCLESEAPKMTILAMKKEGLRREVTPAVINPNTQNLSLESRKLYCAESAFKESGGRFINSELETLCQKEKGRYSFCATKKESLFVPITSTPPLLKEDLNNPEKLLKTKHYGDLFNLLLKNPEEIAARRARPLLVETLELPDSPMRKELVNLMTKGSFSKTPVKDEKEFLGLSLYAACSEKEGFSLTREPLTKENPLSYSYDFDLKKDLEACHANSTKCDLLKREVNKKIQEVDDAITLQTLLDDYTMLLSQEQREALFEKAVFIKLERSYTLFHSNDLTKKGNLELLHETFKQKILKGSPELLDRYLKEFGYLFFINGMKDRTSLIKELYDIKESRPNLYFSCQRR